MTGTGSGRNRQPKGSAASLPGDRIPRDGADKHDPALVRPFSKGGTAKQVRTQQNEFRKGDATMNYSAMIQNRKSVRAFRGKEVPNEALAQLRTYYEKTCPRLVPEIATELIVLDKDAQPALESSAGYRQFLIGAPHYLLLMSARHIHAGVNAGYMMEDLVLKLTELDIDTCWLTFTDSDKIKKALSLTTPLDVAAIVAFGYGAAVGCNLADG